MFLTWLSLYALPLFPVFGLLWSSCCCTAATVSCGACSSGSAPGQFKVDLSGIASDDCDNCEALNGTYYLDNTVHSATLCIWFLEVPIDFCTGAGGPQQIQLDLEFSVILGSVSLGAQINVSAGTGYYQATWGETPGSLVDCSGYSSYSIPLISEDTSSGTGHCDGAGTATFEITSV